MATKADIEAAVFALSAHIDGLDTRIDELATREYVRRMLLITQIPVYLGIIGLYFTGS